MAQPVQTLNQFQQKFTPLFLIMATFGEGSERMLSRKRFAFRALVDIACVCCVAGPVVIINLVAQPFQRGFFCDDQSLMHPLKGDTVPTPLLVAVAMGLPLLSIVVVECLLQRSPRCCSLVGSELAPVPRTCLESGYRSAVVFFLGAAITQLLTEVGKYSVGRLRPHFLDVCRPAHLPQNCSHVFLSQGLCTGLDQKLLKEARLSFPSGHASMSMYSAAFLMVYLQARLVLGRAKLVRPVLQVALFVAAFFTALSRVSDYKHHWSDVLAGSTLGLAVCVALVLSMTDFHHTLLRRRRKTFPGSRKERMPMYRQETSTSSDLPTGGDNSRRTIQVDMENHQTL